MIRLITILILCSLPSWGQIVINGPVKGSSGSGCSEATTAIALLTSPSTTIQDELETFICGLVTSGDWAELYALRLDILDTETNSRIDLITGASSTDVGTAMTWTQYQGWAGLESNGSLDTNVSLTTEGASAGDFMIGCYVLSIDPSTAGADGIIGVVNGASSAAYIIDISNASETRYNIAGSNQTASVQVSANHLWTTGRIATDSVRFYQGGTQVDVKINSSGTLASDDVYTHSYNNAGTETNPAHVTVGMWFAATSSINLQNVEDAFETMYSNLNP